MRWLTRALRIGDRCPPGWELTRAVSEGAAKRKVVQHIEGCACCASELQSLRRVSARAAVDFPRPPEMTADARQAISARLLAAAPRRPWRFARRPAFLLAGATIAVVVVVAVVIRAAVPTLLPAGWQARKAGSSPVASKEVASAPLRSSASIRAIRGARFARVQSRPDDVVRLDEGTIVLEVAPLPRGERFRVRTTDAEVEVRGTRFQVSAAGGELLAVSVMHGRVEVRSRDGGNAVLEAGDEWVRGPPVEPSAAPAPAPPSVRIGPATPPRAPGGRPSSGDGADPRRPSAKASFERAWSLLRQGDPGQAAALFAEVERLARGQGIAEDAHYWRAVATARTGDGVEARRLFADFLARFPASSRSGGAATALGWLLLDAGDRGAARSAFERATRDPSPTVRAGALDGLRRATEP